MRSESVPRHIAIIMDGNGRWASRRAHNRLFGHRRGVETVRKIVEACRNRGVEVLTLYAFSEENWRRPRVEIAALMSILKRFLISERKLMADNEIRLATIGDVSKLPKDVQKTLRETLLLTRGHDKMTLVLALSYGGRDEITRATRALAEKAARKELKPDQITPEMFAAHLDTAGLPDPDLLIRTSGEMRISNFLPWQAVYTEFYVTDTLWPDFTEADLDRAIADFSHRERRFGLTSGQVVKEKGSSPWPHARSSS